MPKLRPLLALISSASALRSMPSAWRCRDAALRTELEALGARLPTCTTGSDCGAFEQDLQDLLFRMVDRPLFKLLTFVTLQVGVTQSGRLLHRGDQAVADWCAGRSRIIAAILSGDEPLARFEADRSNRRVVMAAVRGES